MLVDCGIFLLYLGGCWINVTKGTFLAEKCNTNRLYWPFSEAYQHYFGGSYPTAKNFP
jgi:hypothetical protein